VEISGHSALIARLLVGSYFIVAGYVYARDWKVYVARLRDARVLLATLLLWVGVLFYIICGLNLILGYQLTLNSRLLIAVLLCSCVLYYRFWTSKGVQRRVQLKTFMLNLALVGSLIMIAAIK